ncbi:MAG: protein kinase [Deltaproteobacteria bacterium]|nr:protein kinase [Deltaproteobacteria bacterium]
MGTSSVSSGVPLALKLWHEGDEESLDQLQGEAQILMALSRLEEELPCPRLYDLVGNPLVTGLVMEWCPLDMEGWWREKLTEPDAIGRLMAAAAEVAKRLADFHRFFEHSRGQAVAHGDVKPSNVLLSAGGRWLISDFGVARDREASDGLWETGRLAVGTDNFLPPEHLFRAMSTTPAAADQWSLASSVFALLWMRSTVLEGGAIPRNGAHSPRFRMARMSEVFEVYGRDPSQFLDRWLDASAFGSGDALPDSDRARISEAVRGAFGAAGAEAEDRFSGALSALMDRALAIDPKGRFPSMSELSDAFDGLVRLYLELSTASKGPGGEVTAPLQIHNPACEATRRTLQDELVSAQAEIERLQRVANPVRPLAWPWWAAVVVLQLTTLASIGALVVYLVWSGR